ncbi:MAG: SurA N-terminal domain-containing protein [Alphaproteobacteria bacterium]|nr:SurA N-terminal domain-containing protein [Alphaproteobacteria bacterium]
MLELIRKYSKSIVVKIFLTILAGSFLLFFGFTYVVDKLTGKDYVVKIANVKIHPQVFKYEKNKKLSAIKRRSDDVDDKEISNKILHQIIWENVISLAANDFGVIVSDSTMYSHISNMDIFRTNDGHFNAASLRKFLRAIEMSESEFLDSSRREIKSHIIQFPFRYISLADEFKYYLKINTEKRRLKFFEIDPSSFKITGNPTDADLEEFYNDNSEKFEVPEKRSFSVLMLSVDEVGKNTEISQEEIIEGAQELYGDDFSEDSVEKFKSTDEFKRLKQERTAAAAEEITRQVEDDLVSGSTVKEVAGKFNLKTLELKDVALDETDKVKLPFKKDVMTVAFGLDESEVGNFNEAENADKKLVQWLVYVSDVKPRHVEPIDQAKEKVKKAWYKDQQHAKAIKIAEDVISKTSEGEDFVKLAQKKRYNVRSTAYFDKDGKTSDERNKSEVVDNLHEEIFSELKNKAGMKEINGKIVVYQLADIGYDAKKEEEERQKNYILLMQDNSEDMYQQLIGYLSKKYEVKVNYEVLKEVDEAIDPSALDEVF